MSTQFPWKTLREAAQAIREALQDPILTPHSVAMWGFILQLVEESNYGTVPATVLLVLPRPGEEEEPDFGYEIRVLLDLLDLMFREYGIIDGDPYVLGLAPRSVLLQFSVFASATVALEDDSRVHAGQLVAA